MSAIEYSVNVHLRLGRGEDRWEGGERLTTGGSLGGKKSNVPKVIVQDFHRSLNIYLELEIPLRNS